MLLKLLVFNSTKHIRGFGRTCILKSIQFICSYFAAWYTRKLPDKLHCNSYMMLRRKRRKKKSARLLHKNIAKNQVKDNRSGCASITWRWRIKRSQWKVWKKLWRLRQGRKRCRGTVLQEKESPEGYRPSGSSALRRGKIKGKMMNGKATENSHVLAEWEERGRRYETKIS